MGYSWTLAVLLCPSSQSLLPRFGLAAKQAVFHPSPKCHSQFRLPPTPKSREIYRKSPKWNGGANATPPGFLCALCAFFASPQGPPRRICGLIYYLANFSPLCQLLFPIERPVLVPIGVSVEISFFLTSRPPLPSIFRPLHHSSLRTHHSSYPQRVNPHEWQVRQPSSWAMRSPQSGHWSGISR